LNLPRYALDHKAVVLAFLGVFLAVGVFNFYSMPRREDPEITIRDALVLTRWPGASAQRVDELITDPLEEVLAQVAEIDKMRSKSMTGISVIQLTSEDRIKNTDQVWDDVRAKVESVQAKLPPGAEHSFVNSDFGDVYEIVFALHQVPLEGDTGIGHQYTPRELERFAERIEDELQLIGAVGKVDFWGVQQEQIYIEVDSADWARLALTPQDLGDVFAARNIVDPGGELDTERARYAVKTSGEFSSVAQIEDLIVDRRLGTLPVRLGDLPIRVDRRYQEPPTSLTRITTPTLAHQPALVIGVSMKSGNNVVGLSRAVDDTLARLAATWLPPDVELTRVNDLPRQVETRITDFQFNLLQGVLIVLGVGLLAMGWRPALIMATAVPLSMIAAFAVVRFFGVELEQFSIASLVIALGMVVDSAIVVSDNAFRLMRDGVARREAIIRGAQELAVPILVSTLTTMFAFLPMLTIVGNVGEYVSSLPVVVSMTLAASYFVALLVTPIMCWWLLYPPEQDSAQTRSRAERFFDRYERLMQLSLRRKGVVLGLVGVAFVGSLTLIPVIGSQFFPAGARDQFFIKIWLPEGSTIEATSAVARQVEAMVVDSSPVDSDEGPRERLANMVSYIGVGGPRIMLTQQPEYDYPYYAMLLVNTSDPEDTPGLSAEIRERVRDVYNARITVDEFMLGPPIKDPVAFRLSGPDPDLLRSKARDIVKLFKDTPGVVGPYSNWGATAYAVDLKVDPYAASLAGVTHSDISNATRTLLSGSVLTSYREGDHQVPVVLRTLRESRRELGDLSGIFVDGKFGKVPLNSLAEIDASWQAAVMARRNKHATVTVGARVAPGMLANSVAADIEPGLQRMLQELPPGYFVEQGGEQEETLKAQIQVVRAVGIAMLLMTLVLIVQYNSLLKPLVVLMTVPLAMIGVLLGLWATGWAMGFMAMLGLLALGGIVINNAIVLIDFIERASADGMPLRDAVVRAGRLRVRPIVLTSLTTIGGLLPLSLFGGALWAPMTNGMIFGLAASTVLTLVVVPTVYVLFVEKFNMRVAA
jgi:multidrug efflux pump subunit AcrB